MVRSTGKEKTSFKHLASFRLQLLAKLAQRHADADYQRKIGLSILQCRILGLVGSAGEMSFREICRDTGVEKSHASRLVASLIEAGLFAKHNDPDDQRSFIVKPTAKGRKLHREIYRVAVERNDRWLQVLPKDKRDVFFACIDALMQQSRKLAVKVKSPELPARTRAKVSQPKRASRSKSQELKPRRRA